MKSNTKSLQISDNTEIIVEKLIRSPENLENDSGENKADSTIAELENSRNNTMNCMYNRVFSF